MLPRWHGDCQAARRAAINRREATVNTIIDLSSELLIDRSGIRDPYLRLLLTAIGQELVRGSPWVAVNKVIASQYDLVQFMIPWTQSAVS
jgi:hypothetical protein